MPRRRTTNWHAFEYSRTTVKGHRATVRFYLALCRRHAQDPGTAQAVVVCQGAVARRNEVAAILYGARYYCLASGRYDVTRDLEVRSRTPGGIQLGRRLAPNVYERVLSRFGAAPLDARDALLVALYTCGALHLPTAANLRLEDIVFVPGGMLLSARLPMPLTVFIADVGGRSPVALARALFDHRPEALPSDALFARWDLRGSFSANGLTQHATRRIVVGAARAADVATSLSWNTSAIRDRFVHFIDTRPFHCPVIPDGHYSLAFRFVRAADGWHLKTRQLSALLDVPRSTIRNWRKQPPQRLSCDRELRGCLLLDILVRAHAVFGYDAFWLRTGVAALHGNTPLDTLVCGTLADIYAVRDWLCAFDPRSPEPQLTNASLLAAG